MDRTYLIALDLKHYSTFDYSPLFDEIKKSKKWWHYMNNIWIVVSEKSAFELESLLTPKTVIGDYFFILELKQGAQYGGCIPINAWKWLLVDNYNNYK